MNWEMIIMVEYTYSKVNPSGCGEYTQFYKDGKRISYEEICNRLNEQEEEIEELKEDITDYENVVFGHKTVEKSAEIGVIKLTDLLKNLSLIKKYNFENVYCDEKIYLCADYIEKELLKLRYSNNFILEKDW